MLLKIVLAGYSRGLVSSRSIAAACRTNVVFMALTGDAQPHFSTIANFVSTQAAAIQGVFTQVLLVCDRQGLIGREMFAIDGVKLPSNAAKAKSGRREDFDRWASKLEAAVGEMVAQHQAQDGAKADTQAQGQGRAERKVARMKREAAQIRAWLKDHPTDRAGARGATRLSNLTDNDSAKMSTDKGVVQGYCAVAAVDEAHQIVMVAQAHGSGSEQEMLLGVVEQLRPQMRPDSAVTADAGYHSEANLRGLEKAQVNAYIADPGYRRRDPAYAGQEVHLAKRDALWDKTPAQDAPVQFTPEDFSVAADNSHCVCPAGKRMYRSGTNCNLNGRQAMKFKGAKRDCGGCALRAQCLRHPQRTAYRTVAILLGRHAAARETASERMRAKIDTANGRGMITRRFATVEPVFGNLRGNKRLRRFTLRGQGKVDGQWKLYCLVQNIEKLAHAGYGS